MRCLVLLLSFITLSTAFYLPRPVYSISPYRFESGLFNSIEDGGQQKEKKASGLFVKRFKPCYYSPIQCLIKRR